MEAVRRWKQVPRRRGDNRRAASDARDISGGITIGIGSDDWGERVVHVAGVGEGTEGRRKARSGAGFEVLMVVDDGPGLGKRGGTQLDGECVRGSDDGSECSSGLSITNLGRRPLAASNGVICVSGTGLDLIANSACLIYLNQSCFFAVLVLVMHLNISPTCLLVLSHWLL